MSSVSSRVHWFSPRGSSGSLGVTGFIGVRPCGGLGHPG